MKVIVQHILRQKIGCCPVLLYVVYCLALYLLSASLEYRFLDEFELDLVVRLWFLVIVVIIAITVLGVLVGSFDGAVLYGLFVLVVWRVGGVRVASVKQQSDQRALAGGKSQTSQGPAASQVVPMHCYRYNTG